MGACCGTSKKPKSDSTQMKKTNVEDNATEEKKEVQKEKENIIESPPKEEQFIVNYEEKLEFVQLKSRDIISALAAEGMEGLLSKPQLKRAFMTLELTDEALTSPDASFYKILSKVKNEKKLYEVRKLSLLGILIGKGATKGKVSSLFKLYDPENSESLDAAKVELMFNEIADLCANILPIIAIGEGDEYCTKEEIEGYIELLNKGKEKALQKVKAVLMDGDSISESDFVTKVSDSELPLKSLLSSSGARAFIWQFSKSN
ncbi:unnamed protein product [Blepharisma stoltei]|uniref:Uncharacterized protein n=1 Tax=Blepharisma stoltei TaxID=1481888 RepID=A0AAU9JY08_9CILI|nr:unnamed protein product [Blepharisma stoltei]